MPDRGGTSWLGKCARLLRRRAFVLTAALVVLVHLGLAAHAEMNVDLLGPEPISWVDFDTHAAQAWRVTEALDGWGKTWAYDVQLLAGYPNGTVFDADNKAWELWTYALWKLGLTRGAAFNLFVVLAHLLLPAVVYLSARLLDLGRWEALTAMALGSALWFFDGMTRWNWFSGAVSFSLVSYLFLLPIALFHRYLETGRRWLLVPLGLTLAAGHLAHPAIFVVLIVPMMALYARAARKLGWRRHAAIVAVALFVIAVNAYWLIIAFRYAHYATKHDPFFVAGVSYLLTDLLGLVQDWTVNGLIGNRTGFRLLAIGAAIATLVLWRRRHDRRFLPFAAGIGGLMAFAYLGGLTWPLDQIQPYRSIVPAAFLCTIPAGAFVGELARSAALRRLPPLTRTFGTIVSVLAGLYLVRDVLYFLPSALPEVPVLPTGQAIPITSFGFPGHIDYRHWPPPQSHRELARWVREHDDGQGRFLVDWWVMGEYLSRTTNAPILGGFRQRNLDHAAANLFRKYPHGKVSEVELAAFLERYAVRWIILTSPRPALESKWPQIQLVATFEPHRVYRNNLPVSLLQTGTGEVSAAMNRVDVTGSRPDEEVVLRFHWLETLACNPSCRVERAPVPDDRVGFIRVPAPHPADFVVYNAY